MAINFITTVLNMRAPGQTLHKLPLKLNTLLRNNTRMKILYKNIHDDKNFSLFNNTKFIE